MVQAVGPWGEQIGLSFWAGARGSGILLGLPFPWVWRVGLRAFFFKPYQLLSILYTLDQSPKKYGNEYGHGNKTR